MAVSLTVGSIFLLCLPGMICLLLKNCLLSSGSPVKNLHHLPVVLVVQVLFGLYRAWHTVLHVCYCSHRPLGEKCWWWIWFLRNKRALKNKRKRKRRVLSNDCLASTYLSITNKAPSHVSLRGVKTVRISSSFQGAFLKWRETSHVEGYHIWWLILQ